ncbi:MAG TPA: tetratricopeptide repeat protein [Gemmatimonadaceae bacterium]|nr:tetratricopeptide repeat protein [Gemmatimonadaceae bacterium]
MADSALIADLEKQFAQNPRRIFARLANEYRKAGDPERAIDLCRHHVTQQPSYISGHIVLGQALFDSGQLAESRGAFEAALALDPENLIALRQLGDISRDSGDAAGARVWYQRLLEVDPQNEEIVEQLRVLEAPLTEQSPAPEGAAGAAQDGDPAHWGEIDPGAASSSVPAGEADSAGASASEPDLSMLAFADDAGVAELTPDAPEMAETASDESPAEEPAMVEGFMNGPDAVPEEAPAPEGLEFVSMEFSLSDSEAEPAGSAIDVPRMLDTPGDTVVMLDMGLAADQAREGDGGAEAAGDVTGGIPADTLLDASAGAEPESGAPVSAMPAGDASPSADDAQPVEAPAGDEHNDLIAGRMFDPDEASAAVTDAFVTETMAEVYLQQGFVEQAADVYQQLAERYPEEPRFAERAAELQAERDALGSTVEPTALMSQPDAGNAAAQPGVEGALTIRAFLSALAARTVRDGPRVAVASTTDPDSEPSGDSATASPEPPTISAPDFMASIDATAPAAEDAAIPLTEMDATGGTAAIATDEPAPGTQPTPHPEPAPDAHAAWDAPIALATESATETPAAPDAQTTPIASAETGAHAHLFPDGAQAVSPEDEAAAAMLAAAYSSDPDANGLVLGTPAHEAPDELSLDAVFRDARQRNGKPASSISYDEFFGDEGENGASDPGSAAENGNTNGQQDGQSDLELFHAWLEGLKK